jgi:hypothetical protein
MQGYRAAGNPSSFTNNSLAFLKNIQIDSSHIVNGNWRLPQSVTFSPSAETADFILTGESNPAK